MIAAAFNRSICAWADAAAFIDANPIRIDRRRRSPQTIRIVFRPFGSFRIDAMLPPLLHPHEEIEARRAAMG
jgi:hypothetical protein